jgi:multidrug efflux pump
LPAQFSSFRDPLIVLLGSVPLALTGALLFTATGATTINIYSQVGLITLVGLVAKNGILIVEFANHLQEAGMSKREAVQHAAATRLRPILMTSAPRCSATSRWCWSAGPERRRGTASASCW